MKSSKEIADYVFKARDEYLEKKKKRSLFIGRITSFGTLGAAVAAVLICSFNLLPKIEENSFDVIPDTTYTTVSTIKPEDDTSENNEYTENTGNTDNTANTETIGSTDLPEDNQAQPQQTDIVTVIKPVLTAPPAVPGQPTVSGNAQNGGVPSVTTTQAFVTSVVVVTQTDEYGNILESFETSIVTVPVAPTTSTIIAPSPAPPGSSNKNTTHATSRVTTKTTTSKTQVVVTAATTSKTQASLVTSASVSKTQLSLVTSASVAVSKTQVIVTLATTGKTLPNDTEVATKPTTLAPNATTTTRRTSSSYVTSVSQVVSRTDLVTITAPVTQTTIWWPEIPGDSIHQNSGTVVSPLVTQGWNDDTIRENLDYIVMKGVGYSMTGSTVSQSEVSSRLYSCGVNTTHPDYGSPCILMANVYQIIGLEPPEYVAVRFGNTNDVYYVYKRT